MKEKRFIKMLLLVVAIGLLFVVYGKYVEMETIKSARLVDVSETGYLIEFDGQIHEYDF